MNYKEKLADTRWLVRRREILNRDGYRCLLCGDKDDILLGHHAVLNVHHLRYKTGRKPWEYPDCDLVTLCSKCHSTIHKLEIELEARKSKISSRWICGIKKDDDGSIKAGNVLVSDEMNLIFMVADKPFFKVLPFTASDGISINPIQEDPICKFVETFVSLRKNTRELEFNEYSLPIGGEFMTVPRKATEEEKQMLLQAINDFMR